MAAWLPLIKTALPYVVQVVSIAIPAFTSRADARKADASKADDIVAEQITELQAAVTQNAESVKILAEQLKGTIEGIDTAALTLQQEVKILKRQNKLALGLAVVSLLVALAAVLLSV